MAERTGLEPATPCVTGRYSNQLNYRSTGSFTHTRQPVRCQFVFAIIPCQGNRRRVLYYKFDAWQFPTLAWGDPTLPSALRRFTSEFGMGSGGTTALVPPGKFLCMKRIFYTAAALPALAQLSHIPVYAPSLRLTGRLASAQNLSLPLIRYLEFAEKFTLVSQTTKHLWCCKVKPLGSLVLVSSTHRCAYTPGLSTSSSSTFLQET